MADPVPTLKRHQEHAAAVGGYSFSIVYVQVEDHPEQGLVELSICDQCHLIMGARCEHQFNDWYDEAGEITQSAVTGTTLRCRLCGIDGT